MILLSEKGAHGVSSRCEKAGMLLPQRSYGSTLKNHMLLITNSTTVASQTNPVSPVHMASTSQTANSNQHHSLEHLCGSRLVISPLRIRSGSRRLSTCRGLCGLCCTQRMCQEVVRKACRQSMLLRGPCEPPCRGGPEVPSDAKSLTPNQKKKRRQKLAKLGAGQQVQLLSM